MPASARAWPNLDAPNLAIMNLDCIAMSLLMKNYDFADKRFHGGSLSRAAPPDPRRRPLGQHFPREEFPANYSVILIY
jgi:hypothetical protein